MAASEPEEKEIKVEEIMEKVRENIQKRKSLQAGSNPDSNIDPRSNNNPESDDRFRENPAGFSEKDLQDSELQNDLNYLASNWKIENETYSITSHRPIFGTFLVKGRGLVHGELRRYLDPVVLKQNNFNKTTASVLNKLYPRLKSEFSRELNRKIEILKPEIRNELTNELRKDLKEEIQNEIETSKTIINNEINTAKDSLKIEIRKEIQNEARNLKPDIYEEVEKIFNSFISSINADLENKAWLRSVLDNKIKEAYKLQEIQASGSKNSEEAEEPEELGINYFEFEERFRGSCEDIKGRQSKFLRYFENCSNVLDIGCGRGEFLDLLRESGIGGKGVDLDEDMVDQCRLKGLCIELNDAVSYLEQMPDKSIDGIFIDQVVEHLEPPYLTKLLRLCYQKLIPGHYILIETVNPLSLFSFANFYIDLTHIKPVHPETLKFLLESTGFTELETYFISPVSDDARLQKLPLFEGTNEREKAVTEVYNRNIDLLNNRLYGAQDYAIIGKK